MGEAAAREETARVAKDLPAEARSGLRGLELISTFATFLGSLGAVLGMIAAFQALQDAGARADPAALAGGIWEALLTTAAGMAVAIPASAALTWFESVADRLRLDMEDAATRIFTAAPISGPAMRAAEQGDAVRVGDDEAQATLSDADDRRRVPPDGLLHARRPLRRGSGDPATPRRRRGGRISRRAAPRRHPP